MRIGSLFSGIGGLELGLERAGLGHVVWQVEKHLFRRAVLARHWPEVERHDDVTTFKPARGSADLICGGFPCRGISSANVVTRIGLEHAESGLWVEYRRIVDECRPRWVLVENSPEWRGWVPAVRSDLAQLGYASVPLVVSAGFVGAPHARPRAFVVANSNADGESLRTFDAKVASLRAAAGAVRDWGSAPPGGFRLANGVPGEMGELAAYGDSCCPQVAEVIGRTIVESIGVSS